MASSSHSSPTSDGSQGRSSSEPEQTSTHGPKGQALEKDTSPPDPKIPTRISSSSDSQPQNEARSLDPPLPNEEPPQLPESNPPLPDEKPPTSSAPTDAEDDGWQPVWDDGAQNFYFYNRFSQETTWTNPRVPEAPAAQGDTPGGQEIAHGGYNPAIHGDWDPTAPYAQAAEAQEGPESSVKVDDQAIYTATGHFNRFTGKWQSDSIKPENYNDESKSRRQLSSFFDVDAAANNHNGKSLKAERAGKKLTKKELKQFKEKRRERKEEKRRAWLRD